MKERVLARRGYGGYRQYRIPALATTPSGKILALYDGRVDLDDLPGPIDLVVRISDDNGDTWSEQRVFVQGEGIQGFGDASILVDPHCGAMGKIMVFAQETQRAGFFESGIGTDSSDHDLVQISLWESLDDGATWSHRRITDHVKNGAIEGIFVTSGTGGLIESGAHKGRLLHSCVVREGGELYGMIIYSDDHGGTWHQGAKIPDGNESAVIGLDDGSVLVHSRATPYRISARSRDGGVTLSECGPDLGLPDPSDNGSLTHLRDGSVICTHNHDHDQRRNTVIKRSIDGGRTWSQACVLAPGSSAYSTATEFADGSIGVLYERLGYSEMVFARVSLDEFKPIDEVLAPRVDSNGVEFEAELRFIRPVPDKSVYDAVVASAKFHMPTVNMDLYKKSSRKEIGEASGSTSGDPIFTREEYFQLLGPIAPGLRIGDEIRFSLALQVHGDHSLQKITIKHSCDSSSIIKAELKPGEKIVELDLRTHVNKSHLMSGIFSADFSLSGEIVDGATSRPVSGTRSISLSTETGELINVG